MNCRAMRKPPVRRVEVIVGDDDPDRPARAVVVEYTGELKDYHVDAVLEEGERLFAINPL